VTDWTGYAIDAFQRSVLFLDLMRQRGNAAIAMSDNPHATVLRFDHEVIMDGRALARPMNYSLWRIIPPDGLTTKPHGRPVVVVDPRAGEGPGIGGFKVASEIGDALNAGHPVYFIGFSATPEPGQTFLDVVEGQVSFFERIAALHPNAPRPFAIGNCQAGYQTLMVAMLRPDLFGPVLMAGSPMSFWQGVHGKNPMRYTGGLLGGSWLTALTSDLAGGRFDGAWLVLNFDSLGPANWLWKKQYDVYATVDTSGPRYLAFEKWWGDFITLNGDELQYLVDNLFIADRLTRNQLRAADGTVFDARAVTSPIIVFTSMGDNISPPQETLGWIVDLYRDDAEIRANDRTIVYCMSQEIGHLAIFVSSKVGAEQDEAFVQLIDVIDCLPPGLHELIIAPRPADVPIGGFVTGNWIARFERRTLDDIRAIGRNDAADDRAFAAVAKLSELNLSLYRAFLQPALRALTTPRAAGMAHALNPLRLSYTMFADSNPWMKLVRTMADNVAGVRKPIAADNPFLAAQARISAQITGSLERYRIARDTMAERMFFAVYGSPVLQAFLGLDAGSGARPLAVTSPAQLLEQQARSTATLARLDEGGADAALTRAVIYVIGADGVLDQRCALALNVARRELMHLRLAAFKALVRDQSVLLQLDQARAVGALASLVPGVDAGRALLRQATTIVSAGGPPSGAERRRLDEVSAMLSKPPALALAPAA
jgi:hypothetical protein